MLHYYLGERPKGSRAGRCIFFGRLQHRCCWCLVQLDKNSSGHFRYFLKSVFWYNNLLIVWPMLAAMAHAVLIPRCPRLCSLFNHTVSLRAQRANEFVFWLMRTCFLCEGKNLPGFWPKREVFNTREKESVRYSSKVMVVLV